MKVILLQNVPGTGKKYDIKEVSDGFCRNFLFPKKLAELATEEFIKKIEAMKRSIQVEKEMEMTLARKNAEMLKEVVVSIKSKASSKGSLFKSIHKEDISKALKDEAHISIDPEFIILDKPIKDIGLHKIVVDVSGLKSEFTLRVEAE